jgi:hypothetical protein
MDLNPGLLVAEHVSTGRIVLALDYALGHDRLAMHGHPPVAYRDRL